MNVNDFLNQMKECEISFRRTMLTFICICIISEYQAFKKFEMEHYNSSIDFIHMCQKTCISKFMCLDKFMESTSDAFITFTDIDQFQVKFLSFLPNEAVGLSFKEISRKLLSEALKCYDPSLPKDSL